MARKRVYPDQRFARLVTVSKLPEKVRGEEAWLCRCDCGEEAVALKSQLLHGRKKSCGCLRRKTPANALDLAGKSINGIKIIERDGVNERGLAMWLCECKCGERFRANATLLRRGDIVSCGCDKRKQIDNARKVLMVDKSVDGVQIPLLTKKVRSDSSTGHKGVYRRVRRGRVYYEPSITIKGKRIYGRQSTDLAEAISERKRLEEIYHKPYLEESDNEQRTD